MVFIRLQVHVLPWQDSSLASGAVPPRQEPILPWNEPCDENATIQTLADKIMARFKSIHVGKGDLNIKYLQDFWGSLLDMTTTVGQTFIDRASGVDISNSIVKVVRFPPTPSELENPFRCASIAPESSARPRKRGHEEFTERVQTELRNAPYASTFIPEQLISSQRVAKRQRNSDLGLDDVGNYLIPNQSSEVFENVVASDLLQTSFVQRSSSILVDDSQRSPGLKRRNPYGTPISFPLQSPQGLASFNQRGNIAIPESPPSGGSSLMENAPRSTTERELGNAKSASPELDSSIYGISKADDPSKSLEKKGVNEEGFKTGNRSTPAVPKPLSPKLDFVQGQDIASELKENIRGQAVVSGTSFAVSKPKFRLPGRVEISDTNATISKARDIFDPIDTERETPEEPYNLRSITRLKNNTSLPSKPPGGRQSPHEDVRPGLPILPKTLEAENIPLDLEPLDLDGQNRAPSSANAPNQASSPARAVQETIKKSAERLPGQIKPDDLSAESQDRPDAASECADIINQQVRSTLTNPLNRDVQRANSVEEVPSTPQKGLSQARKLAGIMAKVPSQDYTGERRENTSADVGKQSNRSKAHEQASLNPSLGHNTKDKQPYELVVVSENDTAQSPEDSIKAKQSKTMNLKKEKSTAKPVDEKSEEKKSAENSRQERQKKMVRLLNMEETEARSRPGKEIVLKAADAKARKSKVRAENYNKMNSSEKGLEFAQVVEPNGAQRNKAVTKTEMQQAIENRSGTLVASGRSPKPDELKLVTPKPRVHPDAQTHSSVTLNPRSDASRAQKSMTPALPGPALIKQTSTESRRFAPTPSRLPTNQDSSLQNDTSRTSRTLSRPKASSKAPSALPSSQDLVQGIHTQTGRKDQKGVIADGKDSDIAKIKKESNPESFLNSSQYSIEKTPKSEKIQTKLNAFRDVKGKGRLDDAPIRSEGQYQEPITVSSGAEESASSFGSDEDIHSRRVKAGPSKKRKRLSPGELLNDKASAKEISTSDLGARGSKVAQATGKQASLAKDPAINARSKISRGSKVVVAPETSKASNEKTEASRSKKPREKAIQEGEESRSQIIKQENPIEEPALPRSSVVDPKLGTTILSPKKSSPRAPAQYMSKPVSISSGSDSNTDSETDSEIDSGSDGESDSESGSEVESEENTDARILPPNRSNSAGPNGTASQRNPARKTDMDLAAQEKVAARKRGGSSVFNSPTVNSSGLTNLSASKLSNQKSGREADEQLQRECRQSVGPKLMRAPPGSSQPTSGEEPKLSRPPNTNGQSVQSNLRPSNYPYPSITEMNGKRSEKLRSQRMTNGSISTSTLQHNLDPKLLDQVDSSESSSNGENDSDDEHDARLDNAESKPKSSETIKQLLNLKAKGLKRNMRVS